MFVAIATLQETG